MGKSPKYGREVLKLPYFAGSEATEEHCYLKNNIFDRLNSRYPTFKGYMTPLSALNVDRLEQALSKLSIYTKLYYVPHVPMRIQLELQSFPTLFLLLLNP